MFTLYLQYNVVLLFAVCLEVFIQWQNLTIFNKLKDKPWQRVTHAYYERAGAYSWRCILKWVGYHDFKQNGRRTRKILA